MAGMNVVLMAATPGGKAPVQLGSARSGRGGEFTLRYRGNEAAASSTCSRRGPAAAPKRASRSTARATALGAALGEGAVPGRGRR